MYYYRTQITRQDWFTLALVSGAVLAAAGAVAAAAWVDGLFQVVAVAALSTTLGMALARTRFSEPVALLLTSLYALFTITAINIAQLSPELSWQDRVVELGLRLGRWFEAAFTGGTSRDNLVFVVFLALLFWFLGHSAAWHTFRLNRFGRAVIPPGVVLLVNNFYYEGPLHLEAFLFAYIVLVLLLAVRSHLDARLFEWRFNGSRFVRSASAGFFRAGLSLALVLFIIAWTLPTAGTADLERFQEMWREGPLARINETFNRLFAAVERQGLAIANYYGDEELALGGPIDLSDNVVMSVVSDPPEVNRLYWRSRVYDAYNGRTWTAEGNARSAVPARAELGMPQYLGQQFVFQRVTWAALARSSLVYVAQEPYQLGLDTQMDLVLVGDLPVSTSAIFPDRPLRLNDYYEAWSLVSRASPSALRVASATYPEWVQQRYLQLPPSVTARTRDLALRIVNAANAATPYDQALAIEAWLRREIRYDPRALAPPPDRLDFVDWVLFDLREGYCTYYASAMVVMLRTLGVPARFVAGFAQGEWDAANARYLVRESDAHTWVEVFFPGYGWIEFEPTAIRALPRAGFDDAPFPTATPLATPTPLPTGTPAGSGETAPAITPPATPTAAPLPPAQSGTVAQDDASPGQDAGPIGFIVLLLGLGLLAAAVVIFRLVARRGLDGLSPISRAYARLHVYGRYLGVRPRASETPTERGRQLMNAAPQASRPIAQITEWYNVERYRRVPSADPEAVGRVWGRARRALMRQALAYQARRRLPAASWRLPRLRWRR